MHLRSHPKNMHMICSFLCLPCGTDHRVEFGLDMDLLQRLDSHGTLEEMIRELPDLYKTLDQDEWMEWVIPRFITEHGDHDVRYLLTSVPYMSDLIGRRISHFKKVVMTYEIYHKMLRRLQALQEAWKPLMKEG